MLERIIMPTLSNVALPRALHRGEWEKLSRLCALLEKDGARLMHKPDVAGGALPHWAKKQDKPDQVRANVEMLVAHHMRLEGFDLDEWVIQAYLQPSQQHPESLATWVVTLWCRRTKKPLHEVEHVPTIAEKTKT